MEERKRDDDEEKGVDVEEPLVESDVDEGDDNEGTAAHGEAGASNRATLWLILATTSTLVGRRLLTTDFRMIFFNFSVFSSVLGVFVLTFASLS
jgi:hypothetical protein